MGRRPAFWLAVALTSVVAQPAAALVADSKFGDVVPGFRKLINYTRKAGA